MKHDHAFDLANATILPDDRLAGRGSENAGLVDRWHAVGNAAETAASLAGITPNRQQAHLVSQLVEQVEGIRRESVAVAIDDLSLVMQIGLTALVSVQENGRDPAAAAETLWREFEVASSSLKAMLQPA